MSRKVITVTACDVCLGTTLAETPANWGDVLQVGRLRRRLELCDTHRDEPLTVDQLADRLRRFGQKLDAGQVAA